MVSGLRVLEMAGLRAVAFGEGGGWGALLTTLVAAHTQPVAYEYATSQPGTQSPKFIS